MTDSKEMKLVFAPGCFDNFEGTQEELNELIQYITEAFESGELLEQSEELDLAELEDASPEMFEQISQMLENDSISNPRKLH